MPVTNMSMMDIKTVTANTAAGLVTAMQALVREGYSIINTVVDAHGAHIAYLQKNITQLLTEG